MASHFPITTNRQIPQFKSIISTKPLNSVSSSFFFLKNKSINPKNSLFIRVNSVNPKAPSQTLSEPQFVFKIIILCTFTLTLLFLRLVSSVLLPDFPNRWNQLVLFSEEAEAKLRKCPSCLWQSAVAYEDKRFYSHCGIDPIGIARAVVSFSARGGGSTITQQLIKNVLLKNERTFLRKVIEIVLALSLERTISKPRILSSYLSKIYFGHGVYGIEAASIFYFGKDVSLLSLGECALLVGIIPAPELRSPLRNSSRGKVFQARVLKRMVKVGFLDISTALSVAKESLQIQSFHPEFHDKYSPLLSYSKEYNVSLTKIWDWETESKIWEVREDMEKWVIHFLNDKG